MPKIYVQSTSKGATSSCVDAHYVPVLVGSWSLPSTLQTDAFRSLCTLLIRLYPDLPENLRSSQVQATLICNAEIFYRGAVKFAEERPVKPAEDDFTQARVKEAVAKCLERRANDSLMALCADGLSLGKCREILNEMLHGRLVTSALLEESGLI